MNWFTEQSFLLPNWAWLAIALIVVLFLVFVIVFCVRAGKKKENGAGNDVQEWEKAPAAAQTETKGSDAAKQNEKVVRSVEKSEKPEKSEKTEKAEKTGKKDSAPKKTAEKSEKTQTSVKTGGTAKTEKTDSATTATKPKKAEPAKTEKTDKAEKPASAQKSAKADKSDKPEDLSGVAPADKKPADKVYHISKRKDDGKWQVKAAKGAKALKLFNTQLEAIDYAKAIAENQDARIVIHKEDGSFRNLTYKKKNG